MLFSVISIEVTAFQNIYKGKSLSILKIVYRHQKFFGDISNFSQLRYM